MATVESLAALVGGTVAGNGNHDVEGVAPLDSAGPRHVSFFTHAKYRAALANTTAGAVILAADGAAGLEPEKSGRNLILCVDPYLAMAKIASALHPGPKVAPGIDPSAVVHAEARVDPAATVGAGAVIDAGSVVGAHTIIGATAYVGREARVGADCRLHPGARLLDRCRLGDRVILHAGVVVGSDGFGYAVDADGRRHKIPQLGVVVIEDDVEIGANSTVDRATFGETRIGRGTKIDNLVQIAHNVTLGADCVIVSQAGIAGSSQVGARVTMGAQTGMVGHIRIADDVVLGARGAFGNNVRQAGIYSGAPAFNHRRWLRATALFKHLPDLVQRLRAVERQLARRIPTAAGEES